MSQRNNEMFIMKSYTGWDTRLKTENFQNYPFFQNNSILLSEVKRKQSNKHL